VPRWLRAWAVFTALAALPLVTLGAEVTTKKVGMVDKEGFRVPWHLFTVAGQDLSLGYLIEHGHRLAGFVVGVCCIVLAVGMALFARGWFHRSLGVFALLAVSAQGVLGIFRVNLNALMGSDLAALHGCLAQLVFATLVAIAVLSSRSWSEPAVTPPGLRTLGLWLAVLMYVQVVLGAVTRHLLPAYLLTQRLHVLLAFVVVGLVFVLAGKLRREGNNTAARRLALGLGVLVLIQPVLGVEAWVRRFGAATLPELVPSDPALDLVRSGHHVLGTLIFAATVALAVLLCRRETVSRPVWRPLSPVGRTAHLVEGST
jgi:cytochrome c oxidase assembly protein subunit 15